MTSAFANARSEGGIHTPTAAAATGYVAASPTPSRNRTTNSTVSVAAAPPIKPGSAPVMSVASPQIAAENVSTRRGPNRSPSAPAGT